MQPFYTSLHILKGTTQALVGQVYGVRTHTVLFPSINGDKNLVATGVLYFVGAACRLIPFHHAPDLVS